MVCVFNSHAGMMMNEQDVLFAKLNLETAQIPWCELQRFFAQGKVFMVDAERDLVSIAHQVACDQADKIDRLINDSVINRVTDEQAKTMIERDSVVWAVVVAPWVLIQPLKS